MVLVEDAKHDLLLIITVALVILFATGLLSPSAVEDSITVIPS